MYTQTTLLNLSNAAAQMDIMYRLESALDGVGNTVALSLRQAIREQQPSKLIIQTCQDMITDNEMAMTNILGETLVSKIKKLQLC